MALYFMFIPFGEWCDWVMLNFTAPDDDQDYPSNAEGGYHDQSIYPALKPCHSSLHAVVNGYE